MREFSIGLNKEHILIVVGIVMLVLLIVGYYNVIGNHMKQNQYSENIQKVSEENKNVVFRINQIVLHSSADAIDNSPEKNLKDLSISQYTDIAIYLNNRVNNKDLTNENTINQMYIDHIKIDAPSSEGEKVLNYKNPFYIGKYKDLQNANDRIDFNIVYNNKDNQGNNYDNPTFYTDCSNPISLGYINKNIVTNYSSDQNNNVVSFNGRILQEANVDLANLNCVISFRINIINNQGEKFICDVSIPNNLQSPEGGIYTGYLINVNNPSSSSYNFLKLNQK